MNPGLSLPTLLAAAIFGRNQPTRGLHPQQRIGTYKQHGRKPYRNYSLRHHPANRAPISMKERDRLAYYIPKNPILRGEKVEA